MKNMKTKDTTKALLSLKMEVEKNYENYSFLRTHDICIDHSC